VQSHGHRATKDRPKYLPRLVCFRVTITIWAALVVAPISGFAATEAVASETPISESGQFAFNIPAQPLVSALEAYSSLTGIETLYDSAVARGRWSTAVQGKFTAMDALRTMLIGTSLSARAISQDAFTVEFQRDPAQAATDQTPDRSEHRFYFGLIQSGLERAFCKDNQIRPGGYRVVLKFTIAANGQIRQPSVIGTTGSEDRDRMILRTLENVSVGSSPPADLQQPIMMVILPQSSGTVLNCVSIR
jgi:hypothetical protein